jgi:hypothetical protein
MKEGIMKPYPASKNKTYYYYTRLENNINIFFKKSQFFNKKKSSFSGFLNEWK